MSLFGYEREIQMHCIKMSQKEISKNEVFHLLEEGKITRLEAANKLALSLRQVDRLRIRFRQGGILALVHQNRGKQSNRSLKKKFKEEVLSYVRDLYRDFGPTLAAEKLKEKHSLELSRETLRLMMISEGLWKGKVRRKTRYHPRRPRRECFGELLQGDGSHHAWFEERGSRCVLIGFIDDATNKVYGRFHEAETTEAYVDTLKRYLKKYGKPLALYVDKDSIFRVNRQIISTKSEGETQFGRMMKELGIELICAHSPEAKGRVERLFGTLQDRLVKELRLLNLNTINEANDYLENTYWKEFNKRWSCKPVNEKDRHMKAPTEDALDRIFTIRETRKISKSLDFSYEDVLYQIKTKNPHRLNKQTITIYKKFDDTFWVEYEGKKQEINMVQKIQRPPSIEGSKTVNAFLSKRKPLSSIARHRKRVGTPH